MPLTHQQKKDLNILDLQSYAMASDDKLDVKLEAFEARLEDKLQALFEEFRLGRSESPKRSQYGESSYRVTREWVGEGELPKERTQSKMRRCLVRDAIMQRYDHHFDEQYNGKKGYGFKE
ncbi:hypothetical protein BHE74_00012149 [Ensete ventricosum]|nr:hypothetical protein BHE74_00012149 [Ensete ventricosum]